jgi:anti-repressor protein|nr:MAG TPA: KilAC domain protein [Caudoviricetes sp.]
MCGTGTTAHYKRLNIMNNPVVYDYKGSQISFISGENVMINATQMAKPFGKEPKHWLLNQSTRDFIQALSEVRNLTSADLVKVTKGGIEQGTWMHEDVALEFARWLNPAFAIWCNDRIKELLKTGVTTISNDDEAIAYAMQVLNKRLEQAKQEKILLEQKNLRLEDEAKVNAPKVLFADAVSTSQRSCLVAELAKILQQNGVNIGQNRLFAWMRENGYLCSKGQYYNQPTQKAMDLGLFELKQTTINKPDGSILVSTTTKVTGKGQVYFVNKFLGKDAA